MAFDPMGLRHESPEVRTWRVVILTLGFVAFTAVLAVALGVFYRAEVASGRVKARFETFPGPRLQPNPTEDYLNFERSQRAELAGTRWVDRKQNLVHVPIERAMAFVAAKGNAAYNPLNATATQTPPPTPQDGQNRFVPNPAVAPYGQGSRP